MYKIRGADHKEYGPVTAEQIRHWISQGRANAQTEVQVAGSREWQDLATVPEFADQFQPAPSPLAAEAPAAAPAGAVRTSGFAIASLILGILGFLTCGVTALPGLILGIVGSIKVRKSRGTLKGDGFAIAGTVMSAMSLMIFPIVLALWVPALAKAKGKAQTVVCVNNLKQLALAARIYSANNANHFPPAATWCDALLTQVSSEKVFQCPAGNVVKRSDYAFNARLDGIADGGINSQTVLLFETDGGWNKSGGPELILRTPRHGRMVAVAFADGSVRQIPVEQLAELRWDP